MQKKIKSKKTKAKQKKSTATSLRIGEQIWPMERDILFRPDRMKYVRKLIVSDGYVFCKATAAKPGLGTLCVYKSKHSMIVLNKYPYNPGHILVLPQRHCGNLLELSDAEHSDLQETLRLAFRAVTEIYQPGGLNLGLNHGKVAGAGIPDHLHYHLVPRWSGDLNFFPLVADTKVIVENLEVTFDRLLAYFKGK